MEPGERLFRDVDPERYDEWIFLLESRAHSGAAHIPSEALTRKLLENLPTARVCLRCGCEQSDCNSAMMGRTEAELEAHRRKKADSKANQRAYWVDEMGFRKDCMLRPHLPDRKRCQECTDAEVVRQRRRRANA
jgi:hypothetical protein